MTKKMNELKGKQLASNKSKKTNKNIKKNNKK